MIVLGRTSDDKGTQLERLTRTLLADRSYEDLSISLIGSGGEEWRSDFFPLPSAIMCFHEAIDVPLDSELLGPAHGLEWQQAGDMWDDFHHKSESEIYRDFMLGYRGPINISHSPESKSGVRHLISFGNDNESLGLQYWGDNQQPHFFIAESDLAACRFDSVEACRG
jgi:hypothetical protein